MIVQNGFEDLVIGNGADENIYSLTHLENLCIEIDSFIPENQHTIDLRIHIRPTNHLYSRSLKKSEDKHQLHKSNLLIYRYIHHEQNFQSIKHPPSISSEIRVFCIDKYESSKLLSLFTKKLQASPQTVCVLPNRGDSKTCLSALFPINVNSESIDEAYYLVFFKLHKLNGREINMLIETAFIVNSDDFRVKLLTDSKHQHDQRSFFVVLKNILAGRDPFESRSTKANKKSNKAKKKKKGN